MNDEATQAATEALPCFCLNGTHDQMCPAFYADLLRAWELRTLEKAAKLMCDLCNVGPALYSEDHLAWVHGDDAMPCNAGPIHDAIAAGNAEGEI